MPSVGVYQSAVSSTPQPRRQKLRSGVSRSKNRSIGPCSCSLSSATGRVDVGEREADLRAQVPAIRETHRAGTEHEAAVALDHQHEVLGNEAGRRVERMERGVEFGVGVAIGPAPAEVVEQRGGHLLRLVLDPVERGEHRRPMLGVEPGLAAIAASASGPSSIQSCRSSSRTPSRQRNDRLVERARPLQERQVPRLVDGRPRTGHTRTLPNRPRPSSAFASGFPVTGARKSDANVIGRVRSVRRGDRSDDREGRPTVGVHDQQVRQCE